MWGTMRQVLRRAGLSCGLLMAGGLGAAEPARSAAEYLSETWRAEDGLPQNTVTCLAQTREGYLWLGTQQGLARFDGVRFRVFDTGNTPELTSGRIATLFEDRQGVLWIGSEGGGATCLTWNGWHPRIVSVGLGHEVVNAFGEDRDGNLWAGTLSGLCRWRDGQLVPETAAPGLTDRAIGGLARDGQDQLWALAGDTLGRLQDGMWSPLVRDSRVNGAGLYRDRGGSLWIFGKDLLLVTQDGQLTNFLAPGALVGHFITAVFEAQNGDLWLGTRAGVLLRVRGGEVVPIEVSRSTAPSPVRCLLEDREGNLWVGTDGGGLSRLKPRHIKTFTSRDGLRNEGITSLAADGEGGLWVGSKCGGLHHWKNGLLAPFEDDPALNPNSSIGPLCRTRDGCLWIGTFGEGLYRLKERRVTHYGAAEGLLDNQVLSLMADRAGTLWIGTYEGGLYRFLDERLERFTTDSAFGGKILTSMAQQPNGDIWVGTGGMGVYRLRGGQFEQFTTRQGLGSDFVQTLCVDAAGLLWVGTGGGGLARWVNDRFVVITTEHGLRENVVSQIIEDVVAGDLWLGGNRGLSRVSRAELNNFVVGKRTTVSSLAFGKADGMESLECASGFCPAGLRTQDDRLWFATVKGLVQVTPFAIGVTLPGIVADNLSFGDPRLILSGGGKAFDLADVVGSGGGGDGAEQPSIQPATGRFGAAMEVVIIDDATAAAKRYHRTTNPFIDGVFIPDGGMAPDSRVVISSTGQQVVLPDTTGESWGCLSRSAANPNPAHNQRRQTLGEVDYGSPGHSILNMSGNVGITFDLAAIRAATGREIERFTSVAGNGWVGPASFHVFLDGVRVAYQSDVIKDLDHPSTKVYPLDIPLPRSTRFLTLVTTDDKDNPRYLNNANTLPPPVQIEAVLVDGARVPEGVGGATGVIVRPGQDQFEIQFTALSFTAPEKVRFRYQLEGFDPRWVAAGDERRARYTKLPPGNYRFHVIACNNDGVWNENGAVFALTVIPPFWHTWWFLGVVALGVVSVVGGTARFTIKRRMQRQLDRLRQRHAVEQERARIARDMHDEIGAKLTKISFLSELAKRDLAHPSAAAAQIDQMSDTARDLILTLDEIVWAVNPKNDTLENLANYICRHAGDYFQHTDVQCRFEIPQQVPDHSLSTDARHNVFLAVKEALHNALKHSGAREVRVHIEVHAGTLAVTLTDNGGGFAVDLAPPNLSGGRRVGNGLANMRQRLESIGGHCAIVSEPGQGTTIRLTLGLPPDLDP